MRRVYLDQYTDYADPIIKRRAVPTGVHSYRAVTVARLELYVVEVTDQYEPRTVTAYPTPEAALAAAEAVMARPDSRGIERDWVEG